MITPRRRIFIIAAAITAMAAFAAVTVSQSNCRNFALGHAFKLADCG